MRTTSARPMSDRGTAASSASGSATTAQRGGSSTIPMGLGGPQRAGAAPGGPRQAPAPSPASQNRRTNMDQDGPAGRQETPQSPSLQPRSGFAPPARRAPGPGAV